MFVEKRLESRPDGLAEGFACSILLKQPWILFFVGGQQLVTPVGEPLRAASRVRVIQAVHEPKCLAIDTRGGPSAPTERHILLTHRYRIVT